MTRDYNCGRCNAEDNEQMVQCDQCDRWYHYACVEVGSSVADVSWCCSHCAQISNAVPSMSAAAQSTYTPVPQIRAPVTSQAQFIATSTADHNLAETRGPFACNETQSQRVVTSMNGATYTTITNTFKTATATQIAQDASLRSTAQISESVSGLTPRASDWPRAGAKYPLMPRYEADTLWSFDQTSTPTIKTLQLEQLEEERKIQEAYLKRKYQILADTGGNPTLAALRTPTPAQLAARQVMPKELPAFSGDPEEWPLFISSYEVSNEAAGLTNHENLIRLQKSLKGRARETVKSKLLLPSMVPEIIQVLRMCFGRPEYILERMIERVRKTPPVKDRLDSLIEFACAVQNICSTMEACAMTDHLHNPLLVKELVDKLPNHHKLNWAMSVKDPKVPPVKLFSAWLFPLAQAASEVTSPDFSKKAASMYVHSRAADKSIECCICHQEHKLIKCEQFKNMSINARWDAVKKYKICRHCLGPHKNRCHSERKCNVDNCPAKHHPMLHNSSSVSSNTRCQVSDSEIWKSDGHDSAGAAQFNGAQEEMHNAHSEAGSQPYFRIIPVRLHAKNGFVNTFAFLDEGSSVTLIEEDTFRKLNVRGEKDPLCLRWTGNTTRREDNSVRASLQITGQGGNTRYTVKNIRTVKTLQLPRQTMNMNEVSKHFAHLRGLPIPSYTDARPTILIGADNWSLAVPLKVIEGKRDAPIATKTRLGWTVQGGGASNAIEPMLNFHACDCEDELRELHQTVKDYMKLETSTEKSLLSADDMRAVEILEKTCKKQGNKFEIGLLWRDSDCVLPESYANAERRLSCLQKRCAREPLLKKAIDGQINNLLSKGYARLLTEEEAADRKLRAWYLPIFVTTNPNKPGKTRLVWDAAAKVNGRCLNDFMLCGPDYLIPLNDILLAFRVGLVGVCGDIQEMFHRINVRQDDIHAQRFLWYDDSGKIVTYVMSALSFGVSCAPCIAHFVRNKNAENYQHEFPRAVEGIRRYHYVDDYIDSFNTSSEALKTALQVKAIHAAGGFHIRNWTSNAPGVSDALATTPTTDNLPVQLSGCEKILGLYWNPKDDVFIYKLHFARLKRNPMSSAMIPTKREVLQILMSMFDPLGFISCYTIGLKIIMQEVWRAGIDWDDKLNDQLNDRWKQWKLVVPFIEGVKIARCYSPKRLDVTNVELHTFVDASEAAYAAVSYLRFEYSDEVHVSLVAAKSKVAPLTPVSIPRLELQAAVLGVRLASKICKVLSARQLILNNIVYWSDSKTVLHWLRMDPKNLKQYVTHRVGEILEQSSISQWRWVPTKLNSADLATKPTLPIRMELWFGGPNFLRDVAEKWPKCNDITIATVPELRANAVLVHAEQQRLVNHGYFSSWKRLYHAVATFILYTHKIRKKLQQPTYPVQNPGAVSLEMLQQAKALLYREAQADYYQSEVTKLKRDADDVIRSRARTVYMAGYEDPTVLPGDHHITHLIVQHYHEIFHHKMHEAVINILKTKFVIIRLRAVYKRVRGSCQTCKNEAAKSQTPQMAPLPRARLASFQRPFTYVGVDFFGPLFVTVGRRREKRWGVLFTCLTVRAVHIELAHSLDASSCIMCIRNFIARRGAPREIYSDNGTNFRATEKILKNELKALDFKAIATKYDEIKWNFNPPSAPHMGGAWERLIASTKSVLYAIQPSLKFNDESLRSALMEVELILNSRPLTFVSLDAKDEEAITPNHFLIGGDCNPPPTEADDVNLRERWRVSQVLADRFWKRWVKEYAPTLMRRRKWFTKQRNVAPGDLAVIVDENLPRSCWPKGVITDIVTAKDGQVRRVSIRTAHGVFQRPATKIAVLDVSGATKEGTRNGGSEREQST